MGSLKNARNLATILSMALSQVARNSTGNRYRNSGASVRAINRKRGIARTTRRNRYRHPIADVNEPCRQLPSRAHERHGDDPAKASVIINARICGEPMKHVHPILRLKELGRKEEASCQEGRVSFDKRERAHKGSKAADGCWKGALPLITRCLVMTRHEVDAERHRQNAGSPSTIV
jgi:hypothetical protein